VGLRGWGYLVAIGERGAGEKEHAERCVAKLVNVANTVDLDHHIQLATHAPMRMPPPHTHTHTAPAAGTARSSVVPRECSHMRKGEGIGARGPMCACSALLPPRPLCYAHACGYGRRRVRVGRGEGTGTQDECA
jgi:hypothetical protein